MREGTAYLAPSVAWRQNPKRQRTGRTPEPGGDPSASRGRGSVLEWGSHLPLFLPRVASGAWHAQRIEDLSSSASEDGDGLLDEVEQRRGEPKAEGDDNNRDQHHRAQLPGALGGARGGFLGGAEVHLGQVQEKSDENRHDAEDEATGGPATVGGKRGAQGNELALENAEGRQTRDGKSSQQEQAAGPRERMNDAAHFAEIGRAELLLHIAGGEKQQGLGHGVKSDVQDCGACPQSASEAESSYHDAGVVNARIGEQAAEISLHEHERSGQQNRKHAKANQQPAANGVAETLLGQGVEAHDGVDSAVDETGSEQGGGRHGRFGNEI